MLIDEFGRVHDGVRDVLDGIDERTLTWRADPQANTVAWLIWHLTRVQDDHVAELAGATQVWASQRWAVRFDLTLDDADTRYGHTPEQVAAVTASAEQLAGYHDAVHDLTRRWLDDLDDATLDRVVDEDWDPPVTAAVRVVSVLEDTLQHLGQASFVRGLAQRGT